MAGVRWASRSAEGPEAHTPLNRPKEPGSRDSNPEAVVSEKEIEVFETTAGQVTDLLERLGVPKERMITVMIKPDDWLTKARQE
jgi:hypothetical protein